MKVVAFNGSPKANGNTKQTLDIIAAELKKEGIEVEIIHVGNKIIRGCLACNQCKVKLDEKCIIKDDNYVNEWIQKIFTYTQTNFHRKGDQASNIRGS